MKFSEVKKNLENGVKWVDLGLKINDYIPIGSKYGIIESILENIIVNKNGFYTISRLDYDINLCALILGLYTDIEYENEFNNTMLDLFLKNKFYKWLSTQTNNDSFDFESIFKVTVLDEVRRLNARTPDVDLIALQKSIDELKNVDPRIFQLVDLDKSSIRKVAEEMVKNDTDNKPRTVKADN